MVQVTWNYMYNNDLNQVEAKINVEYQFGLCLLENWVKTGKKWDFSPILDVIWVGRLGSKAFLQFTIMGKTCGHVKRLNFELQVRAQPLWHCELGQFYEFCWNASLMSIFIE